MTLSESYCHVYIPFSLTFYPFSQTEPTFCFQGKRMICESNEFCITICQSVIVLTMFSAVTLLAGPPSLPTADARPRHVGFCVCSCRLWQTFCFQLKRMLCESTQVSISFRFTTYHVSCHHFVSRTTVVSKWGRCSSTCCTCFFVLILVVCSFFSGRAGAPTTHSNHFN